MAKTDLKSLKSSEILALTQATSQWLNSGGAIGDLLEVPLIQRDALYQLGHGYYTNSRYEEAFQIFSLLVTYEHLNERYLMALAGAAQMLGKYKEALQHYYTATALMIEDPRPVFFSAECLLALGEHNFGIETLEMAIEMAKEKPSESALLARAQGLLDATRQKCSSDA